MHALGMHMPDHASVSNIISLNFLDSWVVCMRWICICLISLRSHVRVSYIISLILLDS